MYKARPLLDHLAAVFPKYYQPTQQISIDEMMIGTRCKVSFLQYLPKKPTRFGIKVWVNSEAKSGYVLSLQIYTGAADNPEKKGLANRVVMDLVQMYEGKNHFLYVHNFYTSPALLIDLLKKEIYCTGTVRTNRKGFPKGLLPPNASIPQGSTFVVSLVSLFIGVKKKTWPVSHFCDRVDRQPTWIPTFTTLCPLRVSSQTTRGCPTLTSDSIQSLLLRAHSCNNYRSSASVRLVSNYFSLTH